ncbi:MAG: bifunctional phosphoribosyl-AMP cyclohydrolase/phosphoribosyl-ATP diphosphatase HisIE [Thermodesulfobacteriota bacterium]
MVESTDISKIKFDAAGLVPAIAQDRETGEVLMLAYMNSESLKKTLEMGKACFYSRSREKLWLKGETSGNFMSVRGISYDCDGDTLLLSVDPAGAACHTGERSCFYRDLLPNTAQRERGGWHNNSILKSLQRVLDERKTAPVESSYVASLYAKGAGAILAKVAEEAGEFMEAAERESDKEVIHEAADLLFHTMVMLSKRGIEIDAVLGELSGRFGISGIEEKRRRGQKYQKGEGDE